jgi:hypothetical protein
VLSVYNIQALNQYLSEHKNKRIAIGLSIIGEKPSQAMLSYYRNVIVPSIQKGYHAKGNIYSCERVDRELREMSPVCWNEYFDEKTNRWIQDVKELNELNQFDLAWFIAHIKQIAAEEFSIFIEDPKTI